MKNFFKKLKDNSRNNRGFVAIFAVLLVSIMLAMVIGITSNSYKEFSLSSFAKESKYSFFAADSGMECAMFYDNRLAFNSNIVANLSCGGKNITVNSSNPDYNFQFDLNVGKINSLNRKSCVKVIINKDFHLANDPDTSYTKIQSFGYNKDCQSVSSGQDKSIVERALRMIYANDE